NSRIKFWSSHVDSPFIVFRQFSSFVGYTTNFENSWLNDIYFRNTIKLYHTCWIEYTCRKEGRIKMNVLVVKANNRPEGISSKMYEVFMKKIKGAEHLNIQVYDVFEEDMPHFGQDFFSAVQKEQNGFELLDIEQRMLVAKQKAMDVLKE